MRVWNIVPGDDRGQLQQSPQEQPEPGSGEVLIKVRAASLNHRDLYNREGLTTRSANTSIVPLSDGAGEVVAIGEGCRLFHSGDRVVIPFFPRWLDGPPRDDILMARGEVGTPGVLAEYLVAGEQELLPIPDHLTYAEAATLPCAGVTAWNALASGSLQSGDTVLLLGTGGVSMFGMQFARAAGARSIVVTGHAEKAERARSLGADETIISSESPDWEIRVLALTGGRGADHVLEVGGIETLPHSLKAIRLSGRVNLIGGLSGFAGSIGLGDLRHRLGVVQSFYVGSRATFAEMNAFVTQHQIHPIIDRTFSFDEAPAAYDYLAEAGHIGKVVIEC
jgi:NADPH:quinone reductase-like Zn-dependent oxidoreductase